MKPTGKRPGPAVGSGDIVRRVAARIDTIGEPLALARLDDDTLGPVVDALTLAADAAGRWLANHDDQPLGTALRPTAGPASQRLAVATAPAPPRRHPSTPRALLDAAQLPDLFNGGLR